MTRPLASRLPGLGPMARPGSLPRRAVLLSAIVTLHLLLILWLANRPPPERVARPAAMSVFTLPLPAGRGAAAQPRQGRPAPAVILARVSIVPGRLPVAITLPPLTIVGAALQSDAAAGGCALARDAGDAIAHDPAAMAEIGALSPKERTSADAVMLWDGNWLDPGVMPQGVTPGVLRRVVEQVVADAPADCRDAEAIGPRFIPVPEGDRTVMIVIGSGVWRWADLAAPVADCLPGGVVPCPPIAATIANVQSIAR